MSQSGHGPNGARRIEELVAKFESAADPSMRAAAASWWNGCSSCTAPACSA